MYFIHNFDEQMKSVKMIQKYVYFAEYMLFCNLYVSLIQLKNSNGCCGNVIPIIESSNVILTDSGVADFQPCSALRFPCL